jgi:hypothetical protein
VNLHCVLIAFANAICILMFYYDPEEINMCPALLDELQILRGRILEQSETIGV